MGGFDKNFLWGVAASSYQVEGRGEGPKAECMWDAFARNGGAIYGHNGDVTSDQFHHYKEDVKLMKKLGVTSYRFSLSWPRIFPESISEEYAAGYDYYHRLIDELHKNGIEPHVCLHHWDIPMHLMGDGGWCDRGMAYAFEIYAESAFRNLGEKVRMWSTINEPWCPAFLGYETGEHAPGLVGQTQKAFDAAHTLNLAHGLAVRKFRELECKGVIGAILNLMHPRPATNCSEDILAADRAAEEGFYMFTDPIFIKKYPTRILQARNVVIPVEEGDMDIIGEKIDYLGINYYTESAVEFDPDAPEQFSFVQTHYDKTPMGWDIVPTGLYRLVNQVRRNYGDKLPLYIAENGCAAYDKLAGSDESRVHDLERIEYFKEHLKQVKRLIDEGANIKGYYAWTLVDNYEWALGFTRRFGLVYVDFNDKRRVPKDSYYYLREVIAGHEDI